MMYLVFLLYVSISVEVFRLSTDYNHISLSKYGSRLVLCGIQDEEVSDDDYCQAYEKSGNGYSTSPFSDKWKIFYKFREDFEHYCKPKFSDDEKQIYYVKNKSNDVYLAQKDLTQGGGEQKIKDMSDSFPLFNKNGKSLIIMETNNKASIYNESNFVRAIDSFSDLYDIFFSTDTIFKIEISKNGEILQVKGKQNCGCLIAHTSIYFSSISQAIIYMIPTQIQYQKGFELWISSTQILVLFYEVYFQPILLEFIQENITHFTVNQKNLTTQYAVDEPSIVLLSDDKKYICFSTYEPSPYFMGINIIQLYSLSEYLEKKQDSYKKHIQPIPKPELTVYDVGQILSLEVSYDGSIISYIREDNGERQLVSVFHILGSEEFVYPCYSQEYRLQYRSYCDAFPYGFQVFMFLFTFLILIALVASFIYFYFRLKNLTSKITNDTLKEEDNSNVVVQPEDSKNGFQVQMKEEN